MNKEIKNSIKDIVSIGGTITVSYKEEIASWYTELKISQIDEYYVIQPGWTKFYDIDEAVNYFCSLAFTSKNIGYIQDRLDKKGFDFQRVYNVERPTSDIKEMFLNEGILVDKEAEELNIIINSFPKWKDAVKEMNILIKKTTLSNFQENMFKFNKKYSMIDPYLRLHFVYEDSENGTRVPYSVGIEFSELTPEIIKKAKEEQGHEKNLRFSKIELTLKMKESLKYHYYDLNF